MHWFQIWVVLRKTQVKLPCRQKSVSSYLPLRLAQKNLHSDASWRETLPRKIIESWTHMSVCLLESEFVKIIKSVWQCVLNLKESSSLCGFYQTILYEVTDYGESSSVYSSGTYNKGFYHKSNSTSVYSQHIIHIVGSILPCASVLIRSAFM